MFKTIAINKKGVEYCQLNLFAENSTAKYRKALLSYLTQAYNKIRKPNEHHGKARKQMLILKINVIPCNLKQTRSVLFFILIEIDEREKFVKLVSIAKRDEAANQQIMFLDNTVITTYFVNG